MLKIIKLLKPHWKAAVVVICLLLVQALCELLELEPSSIYRRKDQAVEKLVQVFFADNIVGTPVPGCP